jgi:hypothetical protein
MKIRALAALCAVVVLALQANAATLVVTNNADPAPGLKSFTLHAVGGSGELVNSIAGINIPSGTHNVTPAFGSPSTTRAQWDAPNGAGDTAWKVYDTYLLFNPSDATSVVGFIGSAQETNDNSNPAGLALSSFGQNATVGLGSYKFASATDQITLTPGAAAADLPFMQVVLKSGTQALFSGTFFNTQGQPSTITNQVIGVPEPTTLGLAGLSLLGLVAASRRKA